MASGCPAVPAPSAPSAALATRWHRPGQVGTAPPLSRATTTEYGLVPAVSALPAPTELSVRRRHNIRRGRLPILATKWDRPRSRRRRSQCDLTTVGHKFRAAAIARNSQMAHLTLRIYRGGLPAVLFDLILDLLPLIERDQRARLPRYGQTHPCHRPRLNETVAFGRTGPFYVPRAIRDLQVDGRRYYRAHAAKGSVLCTPGYELNEPGQPASICALASTGLPLS